MSKNQQLLILFVVLPLSILIIHLEAIAPCRKQSICRTKVCPDDLCPDKVYENASQYAYYGQTYYGLGSECKAWACIKNRVMYISYGCSDDSLGICEDTHLIGFAQCDTGFDCAQKKMEIDLSDWDSDVDYGHCAYDEIPEEFFKKHPQAQVCDYAK